VYAHTLWLGTTFTLFTSVGLVHHPSVWYFDHQADAPCYGEAFESVKAHFHYPLLGYSPGRQTLKWQVSPPCLPGVAVFVLLLWWSHPFDPSYR